MQKRGARPAQPHGARLGAASTSAGAGGLASRCSSANAMTPGSLSATAKAAPPAPADSSRGVPGAYAGGVSSSVRASAPARAR